MYKNPFFEAGVAAQKAGMKTFLDHFFPSDQKQEAEVVPFPYDKITPRVTRDTSGQVCKRRIGTAA